MKWEDWLQSQITEDLEHALVALQPPEIVTPTERESPRENSLESACRTIGPYPNLNSHLMRRDQVYDGPSCDIETDSKFTSSFSISTSKWCWLDVPHRTATYVVVLYLVVPNFPTQLFPISPCGAWHVNLQPFRIYNAEEPYSFPSLTCA
jgi:hypothetical protein